MTVSKEIIAAKVEEMAKVSKEKAALDIRYKELEAFFLKLGGDKLRDSKRRTCSFEDNDGHDVTYTEAKTVKIISPAVLKRLMGDAFGDFVKETVDPKYTFKSKELEHTFVSVTQSVFLQSCWRTIRMSISGCARLRSNLTSTTVQAV